MNKDSEQQRSPSEGFLTRVAERITTGTEQIRASFETIREKYEEAVRAAKQPNPVEVDDLTDEFDSLEAALRGFDEAARSISSVTNRLGQQAQQPASSSNSVTGSEETGPSGLSHPKEPLEGTRPFHQQGTQVELTHEQAQTSGVSAESLEGSQGDESGIADATIAEPGGNRGQSRR